MITKWFSEQIESNYAEPNETELQDIYTNVACDYSKCHGWNQWTEWNSVVDASENDGDDYEMLLDHIFLFKYGIKARNSILE